MAFCRWLLVEEEPLEQVSTLACLSGGQGPGRPGPNVVRLSGRRMDQYAAATINRRLAAISGLFTFASMRDLDVNNPVPKGKEVRWRAPGERLVSAAECSCTRSVDRRTARHCGFVNLAACPRRCPSPTRPRFLPASARGGTGRSGG